MKPAFVLGIIAMGLLVACGGSAETTPSPTDSATLSADGSSVDGEPSVFPTLGPATFFVGITGDVAVALTQDDPGAWAAVQINADGAMNLQFANADANRLTNITFLGNASPASGTYQIGDWQLRAELENAVVADVNDFTDPENSFLLYSTSGTITLNVGDGVYNGNFEFNVTGQTTLGVPIAQATVVGSFSIPD
jgi:hypothetical protein